MEITGNANTPQAQSTRPTGQGASNAALDENYENFLRMLTAQVSNQDPLEPMDSTTFVTQLAQLTQVEQTVQTNKNLEQIISGVEAFGAMADVQLLGRDVTYRSGTVSLEGGTADYAFSLDGDAAASTLVLKDRDGEVVRELTGLPTEAGRRHSVTWDGLDSAGRPLGDGTYIAELRAVDAQGETVGYTGFASSRARSLEFGPEGGTLTMANGDAVPAVNVAEVR
ncbi:flagellar hook assembly protein FlgD [Histidinibacterium aquaticum]|uniref:Basal-body rod modification protein FlgD n=1 Tax=Histidinibacterium aquaticum TaxID=2613962 RepID=A0A5J5GPJ3_9RHOB|nr:flagellar hook assembly protein FlgD [Histidinibacterium aquaticum]KAA9009977.1 flagellar hook assembly protein FlgD [Histidinibacterium aquaticum]